MKRQRPFDLNYKLLAGTLIFAFLVAAVNNLVNPNRVPWIGSPAVLEKPADLAEPGGPAAGLKAGFRYVYQSALDQALPLGIGLFVLLALGFLLVRRRKATWKGYFVLLLRLGFAAMFILAALPKFGDPEGFAVLVAQYQFLPAFSVYPFALLLPAFEILVALGLVLTRFTREFAFATTVLMVMFIIALTQALLRELGITCGCFDIEGAQTLGESWFALIRDVALMPLLLWLWMRVRNGFIWQLR